MDSPPLHSSLFSDDHRKRSLAIIGGPTKHKSKKYSKLDDAFENIAVDLTEILRETDLSVFEKDNIYRVTFESARIAHESVKQIIDRHKKKISSFTHDEDEFFVFFYISAHGVFSSSGSYTLSTNETSDDDSVINDAIDVAAFIGQISEQLKNYQNCRKIMFMDACFSGGAASKLAGFHFFKSKESDFSSNWFFCSSSAYAERAWRRDDMQHTYFSSDFLDLLRGGVSHDKAGLSLGDIYSSLRAKASARKLTQRPRRLSSVDDQEIVIFRNSYTWASAENLMTLATSMKRYRDQIESYCLAMNANYTTHSNLIAKVNKEVGEKLIDVEANLETVRKERAVFLDDFYRREAELSAHLTELRSKTQSEISDHLIRWSGSLEALSKKHKNDIETQIVSLRKQALDIQKELQENIAQMSFVRIMNIILLFVIVVVVLLFWLKYKN